MIAEIIVGVALVAGDGDDAICDGERPPLIGNGTPHVDGIGTPELQHRECIAELWIGRLAKQRLQEMLDTLGRQFEWTGEWTRQRTPSWLVRIRMPDGQTAGQILLDEGYAGVWTAEAGQVDWCAPL